ncbi:hypothetical protein BJX61DRAFT_540609 [Aspergillus egyptiacus]|nr:hypothetical protein BJX61DRAFT_540609 [Aspergillus egyptiacus]
MERLPVEIIRYIGLFVQDSSYHDLSSLSQTHKRWYSIAAPLFYSKLTIYWHRLQDDGLATAISELTETGRGKQYLKYTRTIDIMCYGTWLDYPNGDDDDTVTLESLPPLRIPHGAQNVRLESCSPFRDAKNDMFLEQSLTQTLTHASFMPLEYMMPKVADRKGMDWAGIVTVLACLHRHLTEMNYYMGDPFPASLFGAIRKYHPECHLNLWGERALNFNIPGLIRPARSLPYVIPSPLDIICSPNLHAVALDFPIFRDGRTPRLTQVEEYFSLVAMASNLKHLSLRVYGPHDEKMAPAESTHAALMYNAAPFLDTLSVVQEYGTRDCSETMLSGITRYFNLSRLGCLNLHLTAGISWVKEVAPTLQNLERLIFRWETEGSYDPSEVIAAIKAFRPLKFLHIQAIKTVPDLESILERHGQTLTGLTIQPMETYKSEWYEPFLSNDDVMFGFMQYEYPLLDNRQICKLAELCPNLHELRLPIKRSMGSRAECDRYKALGQFPMLRTLVLELHCDPSKRPERRKYERLLREVAINAATDETLATAIWTLISTHQISQKLRNLRCIPLGQPEEGINPTFRHILRQVGRSMLVRRPESPSSGDLEVVEIGKRERLFQIDNDVWEEENSPFGGDPYMEDEMIRVMRRIWGLRCGSGQNCEGCWHSYPLQVDNA